MAIQIRTTATQRESADDAAFRPPRFSVQDVVNDDLFHGSTEQFVETVLDWRSRPRFRIAVGMNAHTINLAAGDADFAAQLRDADCLYCDGQSVVWAARALGVPVVERTATTDLAPLLVERAARDGLRLYFLGASDGVAEEAAVRMRATYPGVQIRTHHGYLDPERSEAVLADIADWRTDVLLIGLGDPLQLGWLNRHRERLGRVTALTSGGLFDWLSERHRRAPQWMIGLGLEWLHRLVIEPGRLWRRYLLGNPVFLLRVARAIGQRPGRTTRAAALALDGATGPIRLDGGSALSGPTAER